MRSISVGVVGSRTFADPFGAYEWLDHNVLPVAHRLVSGGADGADSIAEAWAGERRWVIGAPPLIFRPDPELPSPQRYHVRNSSIVDAVDWLVAFWDGVSRGTASTMDKAERAGKRVTTVFFGPHQMRASRAGPTIYVQGPQCRRTPPLIRLPMDRGKSRGRWWSICSTDVDVHGPGLPITTSGVVECLRIPSGLPTTSLGDFREAYRDQLRENHLAWPGNLYAMASETVWTTRDHLFHGMDASCRLRIRPGNEVKVTSGDSLVCSCDDDRVTEGKCHRVWAAGVLSELGWRVILDGEELPATAPGRLHGRYRQAGQAEEAQGAMVGQESQRGLEGDEPRGKMAGRGAGRADPKGPTRDDRMAHAPGDSGARAGKSGGEAQLGLVDVRER